MCVNKLTSGQLCVPLIIGCSMAYISFLYSLCLHEAPFLLFPFRLCSFSLSSFFLFCISLPVLVLLVSSGSFCLLLLLSTSASHSVSNIDNHNYVPFQSYVFAVLKKRKIVCMYMFVLYFLNRVSMATFNII